MNWLTIGIFSALICAGTQSLGAQPLSPFTGVAQLDVGESHACAVTNAGEVRCWGNNEFGQLGDASNETRYLPVRVRGLDEAAVSVSAGDRHSCAVTTSGAVRCWGNNFLGQLGDGSTTSRNTAVAVVSLDSGVKQVSAGSGHTCALDFDGELRCWGFNGDGQLGIGNRDTQTTPQRVSSSPLNAAITTGQSNSCLLTSGGSVACWGVYDRDCNLFGCGFASFSRPTPVSGLDSGVVQIAAGEYFQCALMASGGVKCWGDNFDGQLNTSGENNPDPFELFDIAGLDTGVAAVSAGNDHGCARMSDGTARCWADNRFGQLGDGTGEYRFPAVSVMGLTGVAHVGAGGRYSCALTSAGDVQCWGNNSAGQLGDGDPWFRLLPTLVPGLESGVSGIAVGEFHSCALAAGGAVKCWGGNSSGQLGDASTTGRTVPVDVSGLSSGVAAVRAGARHSCAVTDAGAALCWGNNEMGQLGNGGFVDQLAPVAVSQLSSGVTDLDGGDFHTCARTSGGGARCWGWNIDSQLGDGSLSTQPEPVNVFGLTSGVLAVSAGGVHSCAIESGGALSCWGSNNDGQIGDGSSEDRFVPASLPFPSQGVTDLSAGQTHTCALAAGGEALCWGDAGDGRLGIGVSNGIRRSPERVFGLASGIVSISAGVRHSCAVTGQGAALCWGNNTFGQLGNGDRVRQLTPAAVANLASGVTQIAAGDSHSCALTQTGAVLCWGSNSSDQLGLDRRNFRVPAAVLNDPALFRSGFEAAEAVR